MNRPPEWARPGSLCPTWRPIPSGRSRIERSPTRPAVLQGEKNRPLALTKGTRWARAHGGPGGWNIADLHARPRDHVRGDEVRGVPVSFRSWIWTFELRRRGLFMAGSVERRISGFATRRPAVIYRPVTCAGAIDT
jgi:hypothetical protein